MCDCVCVRVCMAFGLIPYLSSALLAPRCALRLGCTILVFLYLFIVGFLPKVVALAAWKKGQIGRLLDGQKAYYQSVLSLYLFFPVISLSSLPYQRRVWRLEIATLTIVSFPFHYSIQVLWAFQTPFFPRLALFKTPKTGFTCVLFSSRSCFCSYFHIFQMFKTQISEALNCKG